MVNIVSLLHLIDVSFSLNFKLKCFQTIFTLGNESAIGNSDFHYILRYLITKIPMHSK